MDIVRLGDTERITVLALDSGGAPVTGATVTVAIRRDSNGYWWNGSTFVSSYVSNAMSQLDSANMPGVYYFDFTPGSTDFQCVIYVSSATAGVVNDPWLKQLRVGSWADEVGEIATAVASSTQTTLIESARNEAAIERIARKVGTVIERLARISVPK